MSTTDTTAPNSQPTPGFAVIVGVLVLASAASLMSTDMFSPSLPFLTGYFSTTEGLVQLTIGLNVLAFALAQLLLGPMSDRYGRRPVMLCGLVCFVLASIACAAAQSIEQLIVARIAQGISASVEAVVGFAVIRDLYSGAQRVRALAIWSMVVAAVPALAPIAGGFVHALVGWRANFVIIAAAGVLAGVMIWRLLPESSTPNPRAMDRTHLRDTFAGLLSNPGFMSCCAMLGAGLGGIFAFVTAGPFILVDEFGVEVQHVGFVQAAAVAAFALGSFTADRLARDGALEQLLALGVTLFAAGALVLVALHLAGAFTPATMAAGMCLIGFGLGPIFAVGPVFALDATDAPGGAAAAVLGALEMLGAGLASAMIAVLPGSPRQAMLVVTALCAASVVLSWRRGKRTRRTEEMT